MVMWDRVQLRTAFFVGAGLLLAPLGLAAQEACEFEGSGGAGTASEALQQITAESTDAERAALYAEAYEALEPELDDDLPVVLLLAAQAQIGLGNFAEAEGMLDRYEDVADEPCLQYAADQRYNGWVQLYNVGVQAYGDGRNDAALEAFALANAFHPDLRSYGNAALLHAEMGNNAMAIATYQEAIDADIPDADPQQLGDTIESLGQLLIDEDRADEALAVYTDYLAEHPEDVGIMIKYAAALSSQGRADEAAAISSEIMARDDLDASQWIEVGVALYNAEDYDTAATAFGKARSRNPYSKEAMENFVNASVLAGRPGPVLALADTLTDWYPYDETNHQLHASALARADMNERAMEALAAGEGTELVFHFVQMAPVSSGGYVVRGSFSARGASGTVQIPFEFLDPAGQVVHTEVLTTDAEAGTFRLDVRTAGDLAGFRYKKMGT